MDQLLSQLVLGIVSGALLVLLALGLNLIFGLLEFINFSHGALYMGGVYLYNALNLIASAVEEGNDTPEAFREWMEGREVSLGQGDMTIRECDHQALAPIYILEGLAADEAESRGGDAEFGFREVVATAPGTEEYAPTCDEVTSEFQRVG